MTHLDDAPDRLVDEVTERVLSAPKYGCLDASFVRRVAGEAVERCPDRNSAIKYAKRKLHQAFGVFSPRSPTAAILSVHQDLVRGGNPESSCRMAMKEHASTAERVAKLSEFYETVSRWCGPVYSVADLACGLNPLAIPWMNLPSNTSYWCCDVDRELIGTLPRLSDVFDVRISGNVCDLVVSYPTLDVDVAFLLKSVTTLEQQKTGTVQRVLGNLGAKHVVLSLSRRSLSTRRRYSGLSSIIEKVTGDTQYRLSHEATFGGEVVYHLESLHR